MFPEEPKVVQENAPQEAVTCSICDIGFDSENAFVQHAQQEHNEMGIYGMDAGTKIIKASVKGHEIEFFDFEPITNDNGEQELISDVIQADDQDMVEIVEQEAQPTRSLRSRTASTKAKAAVVSNTKAKSASTKTKQKPTSSKEVIFKNEISDTDVDITDELEYDQSGSESLDLYECPLCGTQFADRIDYIQHCKDHDAAECYQCEGCNELFSDEDQLLQHDCDPAGKNDDEEDLMCVPCNKRMKSRAQLRQHSKMHDSMSLIINYLDFFPCHDCCLLFLSRDKLNDHNVTEHADKSDKDALSDKIDETCTDYQFLDEEKQTDYKEGELYSCGECSQSRQTINELKYHVILHATKFECPIEDCGCQYDQISRLGIHVLNKHINTKNLQCLHCAQAFQTYDDLQTHLKLYCKEKKFPCYECGK